MTDAPRPLVLPLADGDGDRLRDRTQALAADLADAATRGDSRLVAELLRTTGATTGAPAVVFVLPGQGTQWPGMAHELLAGEPVFRDAVAECSAAVAAVAGWSPLAELAGTGSAGAQPGIDVIQPMIFALQVGLAALWRSWGVVPDAVVGHSMGEVAAAHIAGALDLPDAARIAVHRSRLLRAVGSTGGGMALVGVPFARATTLAEAESEVAVAASNGPGTTVLTGDLAALRRIVDALTAEDVFCRLIEVDAPAHSPLVDAVLDELRQAVADITPRPPALPMYSTVTAARLTAAPGPAYWADNLRQPVRFWPVVERLAADPDHVFVELSPHPTLLPAIGPALGADGPARCLPSIRRDAPVREVLMRSLAALYVAGRPIHWSTALATPEPTTDPAVPTTSEPVADRIELGAGLESADRPGLRTWQTTIRPGQPAFVADHAVDGMPVLPATAYLDLAVRLAGDDTTPVDLTAVTILRPLVLDRPHTLRCLRSHTGVAEPRVRILARDTAGRDWVPYAEALIGGTDDPPPAPLDLDRLRADCTEPVPVDGFYAGLTSAGLTYGGRFRGITALWRGTGQAVGTVPADAPGLPHPARLDACLQVALAALPGPTGWLPFAIDRMRVTLAPDDPRWKAAHWVHARVGTGSGTARADLALTDDHGEVRLAVEGLRLRPLERERPGEGSLADWAFTISWSPAPAPAPAPAPDAAGHWLVVGTAPLGGAVAERLVGRGHRTTVVDPTDPAATDPLTAPDPADRPTGVLLIADEPVTPDLGTGPGPATRLLARQPAGAGCLLRLAQAIDGYATTPPAFRVATRGAQAVRPGDRPVPDHAPLWGLGRVVATERPDLDLRLIDLDPDDPDPADRLVAELAPPPAGDTPVETQAAWRAGIRYAARLRPAGQPEPARLPDGAARVVAAGQLVELATDRPGDLDAVGARWATRQPPAAGQVEIEVCAGGLNFADVMRAMGMVDGSQRPGLGLGLEAAGVVTDIGPGVTGIRVGDRVVAMWSTAAGGLASRRLVDARLLAPWPDRLSAVEAGTLPGAFLTAQYALELVARLQPDEWVLIHAATGGVGLAAIQIAQQLGARILATAGSPEKHALLHSLGIEHVMNSRNLDFVTGVRAATGGHGVDVVLNSLSGPAIEAGLSTLAPFGRFVELGKRDIQQNHALGLRPLRDNISLSVVDVDQLVERRPAEAGRLLRCVVDRVDMGELYPLPVETFPVERSHDAVRRMARAQHIGKLAIRFADESPSASGDTGTHRPVGGTRRPVPAPDATYLITGGLGGLGLLTAGVLVALGARRLRLLSRRPPDESTTTALAALRATGAVVETFAVDVADEPALAAVIDGIDHRHPLRGVVHAAGFLDDAILSRLSWSSFESVFQPKLLGGWHLHRLTEHLELDFFVLYSSAAALLGTAGQGNYAAGNSFLDALAAHRVASGRPALSVNWGAWSDIGAVRTDVGALLADQGLGAIPPLAGARWIAHLLTSPPASGQLAVMPFAAPKWVRAHPAAGRGGFLAGLLPRPAGPTTTTGDGTAAPPATPPGPGPATSVTDVVRAQIARIVRLPVHRIRPADRVTKLGVDSLMAVELRNALNAELGTTVSIMMILRDPTVAELADQVAALAGTDVATGGATGPAASAPAATAATAPVPAATAPASAVREARLGAPAGTTAAGPAGAAIRGTGPGEARLAGPAGPRPDPVPADPLPGGLAGADLDALVRRLPELDDGQVDALLAYAFGGSDADRDGSR